MGGGNVSLTSRSRPWRKVGRPAPPPLDDGFQDIVSSRTEIIFCVCARKAEEVLAPVMST